MKFLWTVLVGATGIWFFGASAYNLSIDSSDLVLWICLFVAAFLVVRADVIVNITYRLLGPKPMAVHVIGVPRKRLQKNF